MSESVGGLRGLTNKINIAGALHKTLRLIHREPVIFVSVVLALAGNSAQLPVFHFFPPGPLYVFAMDPKDPVRKLDIRKAVYGDSG